MNSYYSNLIEGHDTHPIDIEKALKSNFSKNLKSRSLQIEAKAHINVSKSISEKVSSTKLNPYSSSFLKDIHKEFYAHFPTKFMAAKSINGNDTPVIPGEIRACEVQVGKHIAPAAKEVEHFLNRFETFYNPDAVVNRNDKIKRIISIAASHQRLTWIHPFIDGNGRVVRLFSDACFQLENLNGSGLWSLSRGLSRNEILYKEKLANADLKKWNNYDGRGNLSNKELINFCSFFLNTAIDQVKFMTKVLDIDNMINRIYSYVDLMVSKKLLKTETRYILETVFLKDKISKKDVERITDKSDKTAKAMAASLMKLNLLTVDPKNHLSPYKVNYPISSSPILFSGLYPKDKEIDMLMRISN